MAKISKTRQKEKQNARRNRQELVQAGFNRRDLMKMGLLTSAGLLIPKRGLSARALNSAGMPNDIPCDSPPTPPFLEPLPTHINGGMVLAQDVAAFSNTAECPPQANPCPTPREGRTRPHQGFARFPPARLIEVHQRRTLKSVHPNLPLQPLWGFARAQDPPNIAWSPGPTYVARYNEPILVRNFNDLPANNDGFGKKIRSARTCTTATRRLSLTASRATGTTPGSFTTSTTRTPTPVSTRRIRPPATSTRL